MVNKSITKYKLFLILITALLYGCSEQASETVTGTIDYLGDAEMYLELNPLHYKYSQKQLFPLHVSDRKFAISPQISGSQISYLVLQDQRYPVYISPNSPTHIEIKRADFPENVTVTGKGSEANAAYQKYLKAINGLQTKIDAEMDKSKIGEDNIALQLSASKLKYAAQYLKDTDFHDLYLKTLGEDLIIKLRAVEYSGRHFPEFNTEKERQFVVDEALSKNFFSYETLKAQRAGIRDFTHYYSRTFGIYDSVQAVYDRELSEYDIKRLAYETLNKKRMAVLDFITEPKARAYAELFLVAERIGELPLDWAESSYQDYLNTYADYPEFIEFITWFYEEIKSVSPGQPAIPFRLHDREGELFLMNDFKGKFVLLDFWAGWCQPCMEEFPYMRDIYNNYTRDELEILGISTEVDSLRWIYDIEQFENPWPQLYGGNGFDQETFKAYKGGGIPFYILVDPDGNIARYNDIRPSFNFTEVLDSLLLEFHSN